jgi:hypothetical protein
MRYNITYRAQRRKAARKARQEQQPRTNLSYAEYWVRFGNRYIAPEDAAGEPTQKRRLGITAHQAHTKSYASNGAREVARRLKRLNKEKE